MWLIPSIDSIPELHERLRIPIPPGLGAVLAGLVEDALDRVETVVRGVERFLAALAGGVRFGESILGRGQPAPQFG